MFSISIFARASIGLGLAACAACAGTHPKSDDASAPQAFYTVTAEIALARHQPRVAALQYAAAAASETDTALLERAAQVGSLVATMCLESVGPQEYSIDPADALARIAASYGDEAAAEIAPHLTA